MRFRNVGETPGGTNILLYIPSATIARVSATVGEEPGIELALV
jgi:hypothetical protein